MTFQPFNQLWQVLKNIPKTEFKKSMDKLVDRSKRCIESDGTYFESIITQG